MRTFPRGGTPEERFWARVSVGNGCWLWDANVTKKGYPNLWLEGRQHVYAHRFSYALHVGPIPDGMSVLHNGLKATSLRGYESGSTHSMAAALRLAAFLNEKVAK